LKRSATTELRNLEALRGRFGGDAAAQKVAALARLERARLASAAQVARLHEVLCYWRAYPESAAVLEAVERMLAGFAQRRDLRAHRRALEDSGIAGTVIRFRFYWLMAIRIARRWPDRLHVDWSEFGDKALLIEILHLLAPYSESPALDSFGFGAREWIERLEGDGETDAAFLIRRFAAMRAPMAIVSHLYEKLDMPIRFEPGPDTPARGREKWSGAPIVFCERPPVSTRPSLKAAARTKPRIRALTERDGRALIDLANATMIPRHRDLLVFLHGDPRDVRIADFGDGLQFACIGALPDRRLMLEAVYGFLTLRNGVPIGYVLASALFGSCEMAYNVFEPFRGSEAGHVYGRFVATACALFGADSLVVDPYQLGHGNREGQLSGAWWFYYKLGFRPRDRATQALVREELARLRRNRRYRSSPARVDELAAEPMYFSLRRQRADVLGRVSLGNIGLAITRELAERGGAEREQALATCADEAARLLGVRAWRRLPPGERLAWERWGPLVVALPGIERWSTAQRRALAAVVRAKGGRRESDFVHRFDAHARLRKAVLELARG
jgi:hypothetical protein